MNVCRNLCQQLQNESPDRPRILHLLALLELHDGQYEKALEYIQTALDKRRELPELHNTSGLIYMALGKPDEAHSRFIRAYELLPDKLNHPNAAKIYGNIANSLNVQRKYDEALTFHEQALSINQDDPFALWNRAQIYLLHGQFEQGWKGYESRTRIRPNDKQPTSANHAIPQWDGSSLKGKRLLVHDEQGYGDVIQFSRYLSKLVEYGGEVIFETRQPLFDLLKHIPGVSKICLRREAIYKQLDFDYHIHLCSLPVLFSTTLETIPATTDNLFVDPDKVSYWSAKIAQGKFRVGLVWTGNLKNIILRHRSCPLHLLQPLLGVRGVTFVGLQKGEKLGEIEALPEALRFNNPGDAFDNFADTAAVIGQLDLIITVDTAVAHLAGTLGKPVWLLLSHPPDFRWLLEREDSPWYPNMRIFRQTEHACWETVIKRVVTALGDLIKKNGTQ